MQPERKAAARGWRESANQDARIANLLAETEPNAACFHAQQAGEKALKAALVFATDDIVRTHVLTLLLDELNAAGHPPPEAVLSAARLLDRYYIPTRYPDAVGDVDPARFFAPSDAHGAMSLTETIFTFVDDLLRGFETEPPPEPLDETVHDSGPMAG